MKNSDERSPTSVGTLDQNCMGEGMAIPDFQTIMLPLMQYASNGEPRSLREAIDFLADYFHLTEAEQQALLPSGKQAIFANRVGWSRTHLKKAGLLEYPTRAAFKITQRGIDLLASQPPRITMKLLKQFPEYLEFLSSTKVKPATEAGSDEETIDQATPEETLEYAYQELRKTLAQEILDKIKSCPPSFFERLVVELVVKMGYGGSIQDAGRAIGRSGDEGIDGIIKEDRLGLDLIYLQAKRWNDTVGRSEIQKFVGALAGQGAKKGIFITTSRFSEQAKEFIPRNDTKIVLINGEELAQYMIDFDLGVSTVSEYLIKKIDLDYFEGE